MMDAYSMATNFAALFLQQEQNLTREQIRTTVDRVCDSNGFDLSDQERGRLARELESQFQTVIGRESEMRGDDRDWDDWLRQRSADIEWRFWLRYKTYLGQQSFSSKVLARLEESTDRVLNLMGNPVREGAWDRRGLVVGLVQSGKTAHYVGVMNKAVDAGYKVIVVLTGFNENLRIQTQIRAEEGFLGYSYHHDSSDPGKQLRRSCGVDRVSPIQQRVDSVTTRRNDFKTSIANQFAIHPGGNPIVFVVKKNATVLKHLLNWVVNFASAKDAQGQRYVPALPLFVVDDESDVGSVNTKKGAVDDYGDVDPEHDPSKINKQIRKLLSLFDQSSYVGYTATPFANVLIHNLAASGIDREDGLLIGEDLFPRSFIVTLPTPSNHVGPTVIFGNRRSDDQDPGLPITRVVTDASINTSSAGVAGDSCWMPESHKKDHVPRYEGRDELPPSLRRAILSFFLVCCARELRGDGKRHNSMLVHVTRFVDVQGRVHDQISEVVSQVRDRLRNSVANTALLEEFRDLWERGVSGLDGEVIDDGFTKTSEKIRSRDDDIYQNPSHAWCDVEIGLRRAVESIEVRKIHGQSGEDLNYDDHPDGLNVIAIGGDKLSRGLTLEGLSVSYFLRCSKMYDTLMQMGRWFGYRPGYLDLCRLYTTQRLCRWFSQIADATEELRLEFDRMAMLKCTPEDFGLRVRSHPEMLVTSAVKMRHGESRQVTFQGSIVETIDFSRKKDMIQNNWEAGVQLVINAKTEGGKVDSSKSPVNWEWEQVSSDHVLGFLKAYQEHKSANKVKTHLLHEYIRKEMERDRLIRWRILVATGVAGKGGEFAIGKITGSNVQRDWNDNEDHAFRKQLKSEDHYRIKRLVSPNHETAGLDKTTDRYKKELERSRADWEIEHAAGRRKGKRPPAPSGIFLREIRSEEEGLLMLYPLDSGNGKSEEDSALPILGFAISFPSVNELSSTKVTYTVNNVYQQEELGFQ